MNTLLCLPLMSESYTDTHTTRQQMVLLYSNTEQFMKRFQNTPETADGPGGRDRTLAAWANWSVAILAYP